MLKASRLLSVNIRFSSSLYKGSRIISNSVKIHGNQEDFVTEISEKFGLKTIKLKDVIGRDYWSLKLDCSEKYHKLVAFMEENKVRFTLRNEKSLQLNGDIVGSNLLFSTTDLHIDYPHTRCDDQRNYKYHISEKDPNFDRLFFTNQSFGSEVWRPIYRYMKNFYFKRSPNVLKVLHKNGMSETVLMDLFKDCHVNALIPPRVSPYWQICVGDRESYMKILEELYYFEGSLLLFSPHYDSQHSVDYAITKSNDLFHIFTKDNYNSVDSFAKALDLDDTISIERNAYEAGFLYSLRTKNPDTYKRLEFMQGKRKYDCLDYLVSYGDKIHPYTVSSLCLRAKIPLKEFDFIKEAPEFRGLPCLSSNYDGFSTVDVLATDFETFSLIYDTEYKVKGRSVLFHQKMVPKFKKIKGKYQVRLIKGTFTTLKEVEELVHRFFAKVEKVERSKAVVAMVEFDSSTRILNKKLELQDKIGYFQKLYFDRVHMYRYNAFNLYEYVVKPEEKANFASSSFIQSFDGKVYYIELDKKKREKRLLPISINGKTCIFVRSSFSVDLKNAETVIELNPSYVGNFVDDFHINSFHPDSYSLKDGGFFSLQFKNYSELDSFIFRIIHRKSFLENFKKIIIGGKNII